MDDNNHFTYIYQVVTYFTKKDTDTKCQTDMYFVDAKRTHFALRTNFGYHRKVFYIRVSKDSYEYASAVHNDSLSFGKKVISHTDTP